MSEIKAESKNDNSIEDASKVSVRERVKRTRQAEFSCLGGVRAPLGIRGKTQSFSGKFDGTACPAAYVPRRGVQLRPARRRTRELRGLPYCAWPRVSAIFQSCAVCPSLAKMVDVFLFVTPVTGRAVARAGAGGGRKRRETGDGGRITCHAVFHENTGPPSGTSLAAATLEIRIDSGKMAGNLNKTLNALGTVWFNGPR